MAQTAVTRRTSSPGGGNDWTVTAADRIESAVGVVRDNATTRLVIAARGVVFGLIAAVLGVAALLLLVVGALRLADVYLANWHVLGLNTHPGRSVWLADVVLGGIFLLPGLFLLRKATARRQEG